jgi:RNA polymerase sigma-B factor
VDAVDNCAASNDYCGNPYCCNSYCAILSALVRLCIVLEPDASVGGKPRHYELETRVRRHDKPTKSSSMVLSAQWPGAPVPLAPSPDVQSRRRAVNDDRRNGAGDDRLARALDERRLFARYRGRDDQAARDALVERFLPLATGLARRYHRGGEPLDDLVQVASMGLLKAIDRFDPARGTAFSSFAVPTIAGELKRYFRDKGWSVRVPRDLQELSVRVDRATDRLFHELGRVPTASEIAHDVGVSIEQVLEAREVAAAYRAQSLDRPCSDDDQDGTQVVDTLGGDDPGYRQAEHSATLESMMSVLSDREREILRLRFVEDLTQSEIGDRVGFSQMHVSRVLRQAVARLREAAESSEAAA